MADEKKPMSDVAQLRAENEVLQNRLATIEKLLAAQQPVLQPIKLIQDRDEEFAERQKWLNKTCQERTQEIARKKWNDSTTEYPVKVADVPEIMVPARSPEEAKGRYDVLCGIIGVDSKHKYQIGKPVAAQVAA